jgi:hypothetical protein
VEFELVIYPPLIFDEGGFSNSRRVLQVLASLPT